MMTDTQANSPKGKTILYWITTTLLSLGMVAGGIGQLVRLEFNVVGITHLGYPLYFTSIIGTWKLLGVVAILIPGYPLVKEWAYAGFFFAMTGAVISHIMSGDPFGAWIAPLVFAGLTVASWALRPASRKLPDTRVLSRDKTSRTGYLVHEKSN